MLNNLDLKKVYDSDKDDILNQFYIPVLKESIIYKRISGFFSSTSLLLAAEGIANFINNNGTYKLITSVVISEQDYEAIQKGIKQKDNILINNINFNIENLKREIEKDYLKILSWLIAINKMQIKIALLPESLSGLFHEKIGIFEDKNKNKISFSGSINESAQGWTKNIEEFKVFRSWIKTESEYLNGDVDKFEKYWNNLSINFNVVDLPEVIKKQLFKVRPKEKELKNIVKRLINYESKKKIILREYQKEAIFKWKHNNYRGIWEMATGTGKTITAISAINKLSEIKNKYFVVCIVPYAHLITQWSREFLQFLDPNRIVYASSDYDWKEKLSLCTNEYNDGFIRSVVVITTYNTASSQYFISLIKKISQVNNISLIADEMHWIGSRNYSKAMIEEYNFRLGLSATPTRWFDDEGTIKSFTYFNKVVFSYPLKLAIKNGFLTQYNYYPKFISLTSDEFDKYLLLTKRIISIMNRDNQELLTILSNKRSKVIKEAVNKIPAFEEIINELKRKTTISHLLIYCDSINQVTIIQKILNSLGIVSHKFTQHEKLSERKLILKKFDEGIFQCLVAVKCLDEGVDIPSTHTAIIIASTSNPREYIQRRGRILRLYQNKTIANIYDLTVLPPNNLSSKSIINTSIKNIIKKEFRRIRDFLDTALNKTEIINNLYNIMNKYNIYFDHKKEDVNIK